MHMSEWRPIKTAPRKGDILLLCGETIPDSYDVRSGIYIDEKGCEELGYPGNNGGWLIWNSGSDFFVLSHDEPTHWAPMPEPQK
jgi:hypothetical protein